MNDAIKTQISAFVDGELPDNESELLLRRLSQDSNLRQLAAEYFALSRAIRGHSRIPGFSRLREDIMVAIDDESIEHEVASAPPRERRYLRQLGGLAIAASVAVMALLGLQRLGGVTPDEASSIGATGLVTEASYTVPAVYHELHREGVNNINARLATLRRLEGEIDRKRKGTDAAEAGGETDPSPRTR